MIADQRQRPDPRLAFDPRALGLVGAGRAFFRRRHRARRARSGGRVDRAAVARTLVRRRGSSRPRPTSAPPIARRIPGTAGGRRASSRCTPTAAISTCSWSTACTTAPTSSPGAKASPKPCCCARRKARRDAPARLLAGPGKLCAGLGITRAGQRARPRLGRAGAHLRSATPLARSDRRLAPDRHRLRRRREGTGPCASTTAAPQPYPGRFRGRRVARRSVPLAEVESARGAGRSGSPSAATVQ